MKFTEENLINSFPADDVWGKDLEFNIDGKTVWLRNAPFMDDIDLDEWYWTDETIQYALENGGLIEYE